MEEYVEKLNTKEIDELCFVMGEFTEQLRKRNHYLQLALLLMAGLEIVLLILMLTAAS
jgi:hypothetical protein